MDPSSRANTPLLKRSGSRVNDQIGPTTLVLLCHDYSGGYHDYESVRPSPLQNKLYACHYPQYINTFVYFSHKLVCIPPPTWINTMHRNGVKVLGTFMIERGSVHIERMLDQVNGEFFVAKQLAVMVRRFSKLSLPVQGCLLSRKTSCRGALPVLAFYHPIQSPETSGSSNFHTHVEMLTPRCIRPINLVLMDGYSTSNWNFPGQLKISQRGCVT